MINKIVIVRPFGYFGGTLVLDYLSRLLRDKGIDSRVFYVPIRYCYCKDASNPYKLWKDWIKSNIKRLVVHFFDFCPFVSYPQLVQKWKDLYRPSMPMLKEKYFPFFNEYTVVVYPELIYGNILHAKKVVRWFLSYNRFPEDDLWYDKSDLFICFREVFNDIRLNPEVKTVCVSYFDSQLYRQIDTGKRGGVCYIVRKGINRTDLPQKFDGPIIDKYSEEEKVRVLSSCEKCYIYDTQTFYASIAAVCGCLPIVVLEPGKNKSDYYSDEEIRHSYGIAYGESEEEIRHAKETRGLLLKSLDFSNKNEENVAKFVSYIEEMFGKVRRFRI